MKKIIFVCWGNICRSPMAERVAEGWLAKEGLDVDVSSAGVSNEEHGNPIDYRARRVLEEHGYRAGGHRAHRITAAEISSADLVIGLEQLHVDMMRRIAPKAQNLRLLTDFDPAATPGSGIVDPWYGDQPGFYDTLASIEASMPGIVDACR